MKLKYKILSIILLLSLLCFIIYFRSLNYNYPNSNEIDKRLNYLERVIQEPLIGTSEISKLGNESYEFMLFTYAFSTYAATNIAINDSSYTDRSIKLIRESILKVLDKKIYSPYGIDSIQVSTASISDQSVLYLGHLNLMLGCYRILTQEDSTFNKLNDKISESLFLRYNNSSSLCLESYPQAIWIPDNTVALASLKLYSHNTAKDFDSICSKWIEYAKSNYLDNDTGVLYSTISSTTGLPLEEPRGSMLGWSIMFIYQFDSDFATELYQNYKKHFSDNLLLFRLFKERHNNRQTSLGDIDSGPILWGYSIPANEFALSNSVLDNDFNTAGKIIRLIHLGSSTIEEDDELKYRVRFINMNISPMAEALVLHSLTMTKWTQKK